MNESRLTRYNIQKKKKKICAHLNKYDAWKRKRGREKKRCSLSIPQFNKAKGTDEISFFDGREKPGYPRKIAPNRQNWKFPGALYIQP